MEKFKELGLSDQLLKILEGEGFESPTEIQKKTIPLVLAGEDIIGGSATGSGKTLAFASGIIENLKPNNHIQSLIMTPTRELAQQITRHMKGFSKHKQLEILPIYGGVNIRKQIKKIPSSDVIVGTPGRILDHLNRGTLKLDKINFLVLDEVDRMFDMGFHFDVEKIIKQCNEDRQTMLFSATVSSAMNDLSQKYTKNAKEISVESFVDTSKLKQVYYDTPSNLKFSLLVHLLEKEKSNLVMVFCSTRRYTDTIARNLKRLKLNAKAIHGGKNQNKRTRVMKKFREGKINILVCTDVAARGLDIKEVSHVYNYDLPKTKDKYVHRIGRTARAGDKGKAINILSERDHENLNNILRDGDIKIVKKKLPFLKKRRMITRRSKHKRGKRGKRYNSRSRNHKNRKSSRNNYSKSKHKRNKSKNKKSRKSRHKRNTNRSKSSRNNYSKSKHKRNKSRSRNHKNRKSSRNKKH